MLTVCNTYNREGGCKASMTNGIIYVLLHCHHGTHDKWRHREAWPMIDRLINFFPVDFSHVLRPEHDTQMQRPFLRQQEWESWCIYLV